MVLNELEEESCRTHALQILRQISLTSSGEGLKEICILSGDRSKIDIETNVEKNSDNTNDDTKVTEIPSVHRLDVI